jgi:DNA ligase-1
VLLSRVVDTSAALAATRSRKEKAALIADTLRASAPTEIAVVASFLAGSLRQRRTGVGWRGASLEAPAAVEPSLTVSAVHEAFDSIAQLSGPGSQRARNDAMAALFGAATVDEQSWLRGVITGAVRQGALDSLVQEGLAQALTIPLALVRRAAMLAGGTVEIAQAAATGGAAALEQIGLSVGTPVLPMLASAASDVSTAMAKAGGGEVAIDVKLDGIRVQVHKDGDDVLVATRSLDDITARVPEVVAAVRSLAPHRLILDGEALALTDQGRPRPFQETAALSAQASATPGEHALLPYFFDLLHVDGTDLLDEPASVRAAALADVVPEPLRVPRLVTADPVAAEEFAAAALRDGHEGVVVKNLNAPYAASRRGAAWVKVKPVHTFDLVVLAVEWGSGRRTGLLSNIHLGARDPHSASGFATVGKTFKGMTDEMLAWQTERFTELALDPGAMHDSYVVHVRPEQVVEIALDGIQTSTRYPGGIALRFARVVGYRYDKSADEADTLAEVKAHFS